MKKTSIDWTHATLHARRARLLAAPRSKPEVAATTTLLSVLGAVDEFGLRFMRRVGGPRYSNLRRYFQAFCEVPARTLMDAAGLEPSPLVKEQASWGKHDRPDGVIVVSRNREWRALVEVKTGSGQLGGEQVGAYHRMAMELGFDALITISNEVGGRDGSPPPAALTEVRAAHLRKVPVFHVQWRDLLADGLALHSKHLEENVEDEDQDWVLGEWLRFIHDQRSEVMQPVRLGDGWADVLQLTKKRLLQPDSTELQSVVECWGDLAREVEFQMRINGLRLEPSLSRQEKKDPLLRHAALRKEAIESRRLTHSWKCPSPVHRFNCVVDLDSRVARLSFEVRTFAGRTAAARVMCWARQIQTDLAKEVVVRPKWKRPAIETPLLLADCTGARPLSVFLKSKGIDSTHGAPTRLAVEWTHSLQGRAGRGGQNHIDQICAGVRRFYAEIMAGLRSVESLPEDIRPSAVESEVGDAH